jgi:putative glutamine amidotransferase
LQLSVKLHIGLSFVKKDDPHYNNYSNALRNAAEVLGYEIDVTDLPDHPERINEVDGIVFTGGADVNPRRYGKPELLPLCKIEDDRDKVEFEFADQADKFQLPILGICRGLQLLNVHYGGTLIADLESVGKRPHTKIEGKDQRHEVQLEPGKLAKKISGVAEGNVTSAHHQAIDELAPGLIVSAKSMGDEVIEAVEWNDQSSKPFFLAVQWHPERMDFNEPLAGSLFESFLWEAAAQKMLSGRLKKQDTE